MDVSRLRVFFQHLDRALFIDNENKVLAHIDSALPIGFGQTISQPSLVLQMTELLSPEPDSTVLEIGTGTGYQTALLAEFSEQVYTIERIGALSDRAKSRLASMGYANIEYMVADGSAGWPEKAPFDRIMVTAAAARVPEDLVGQLKNGGRMIVPVGSRYSQDLLLITKDEAGRVFRSSIEAVIFVEMKGKYGWDNPGTDNGSSKA
jgi:protein-L-isoaspartate(D-aspartate) O-methyltransferase